MRVLLLGWTNSPHVLGWAQLLAARGFEVHLAGRSAEAWPESSLPDGLASTAVLENRGPPVARGLLLSRRIRNVADAIRPDLVHAHWLPEFGWIAAREHLRPLICSAWGSDVLGAGGLVRWRSRLAVNAADLVLADSRPLADAVRALGSASTPVELVHWGVNLDRFHPGDRSAARAALGWHDAPTVLSTRALGPNYRPEVLIAAVARLRKRVPDVQLVLKHPEPSVPTPVATAVARSGLGDAVRVIGHVSEDELAAMFRAADVAVSIPLSDSSPRSAWEALASGIPLVVSDLPWARDELAGADAAVLVAGTVEDVEAGIAHVLTDAAAAGSLALAGRRLAERLMDVNAQFARVDALYRKLGSNEG